MTENTKQQQPADLMEMLTNATSTKELPGSLLTRGKGLSNEKAVLFLMQHLEGIDISSPDDSK